MAIKLNITRNSVAFTNMRVYRATTKAAVYASLEIADVAFAAQYVDSTIVDGQNYFYGVELYNGSAKTRLPIVAASSVSDFGPYTVEAMANIPITGTYTRQGDGSYGLIFDTNANVNPNMPSLNNTRTKLEQLYNTATGQTTLLNTTSPTIQKFIALLENKLVVLPTTPEFSLSSIIDADFATRAKTFTQWLIANPNLAVFDINGYRWRAKVLTKEAVNRNLELYANNESIPRKVTRLFPASQLGSFPNCYVWNETDSRIDQIFPTGTGANFAVGASAQSQTRYLWLYFEYVGATP